MKRELLTITHSAGHIDLIFIHFFVLWFLTNIRELVDIKSSITLSICVRVYFLNGIDHYYLSIWTCPSHSLTNSLVCLLNILSLFSFNEHFLKQAVNNITLNRNPRKKRKREKESIGFLWVGEKINELVMEKLHDIKYCFIS